MESSFHGGLVPVVWELLSRRIAHTERSEGGKYSGRVGERVLYCVEPSCSSLFGFVTLCSQDNDQDHFYHNELIQTSVPK